jgi:ElaB/YqjD/DUF883 family membrane-anchored ribosome-binding protein
MAEGEVEKERAAGEGNGMAFGFSQATETIDKLRGVVDQATRSIKDLTQVSEQWAQEARDRARDVAKQLGVQSDWASGKISETVEHNPLASIAVAFALGFLAASLIKR